MSLEKRLTQRLDDIESERKRMTDAECRDVGAAIFAFNWCIAELDPERRDDRIVYGQIAAEFLRDTTWVRDRRRTRLGMAARNF